MTPVQGVPWQQVTLMPNRTIAPDMGSATKREMGILQVALHYPLGAGAQAAYVRAATVLGAFVRGLSLNQGIVRVVIDEHPYVSQAVSFGAWFVVPVSVPYFADIQG